MELGAGAGIAGGTNEEDTAEDTAEEDEEFADSFIHIIDVVVVFPRGIALSRSSLIADTVAVLSKFGQPRERNHGL